MTAYDLTSLNLPKLTGTVLQLFTAATQNPFTRSLLLPSLLANGGIPFLREQSYTEPPTYYPLVPPTQPVAPHPFQPDQSPSHPSPFRTITDYARAYRSGETTPLQVAEQLLGAIQASQQADTDLRLFIAFNCEDILSQAAASTQRFAQNSPLSLVDGVPVAVKDEVDMLPYPTTVGTRFLGSQPARQDSTVVSRLRAAGALLVGKTNMHEIGINPNGYNDAYGAVKNPYDLSCDPGGSSSGSAAAVACGIVPAAIGADGGGSIRIPAALCGIVGLKATFGRISEYGAAPLCWSVAHLGPLTVSVEDSAIIYSIIAGADENDPNTALQPPINLQQWNKADLSGVTAGIYPEWFDHADAEVVQTNRHMLSMLKDRGLVVKEITIPDLNAMRVAHAITILSEMAMCMKDYTKYRSDHGSAVRLTLTLGEVLNSTDYVQAQRVRSRALVNFKQIFKSVDIILTPGTARTAQPVPVGGRNGGWTDLSLDTEMMRFIFPGNLLGLPAIAFPSGYDQRGLPISMQAIGRHWQEDILLRTAYNAERVLERKLPKVFFG